MERDEHLKEAQTNFLLQCENKNLVPVPYGMVQYKGRDDEINLKNYMVNDIVAGAYGQSLQLSSNVKRVNFANNQLSKKGSYGLLQGLNQNIVEVNLSNNQVGSDSIVHIAKSIQGYGDQSSLQILKLDSSGLTDRDLALFLSELITKDAKRVYISELSFAQNNITDAGAISLARLIEYERSELKRLNLHWNRIGYRGGIMLAEALVGNTEMKIVDLSWNLMGQWKQAFLGKLPTSQLVKL